MAIECGKTRCKVITFWNDISQFEKMVEEFINDNNIAVKNIHYSTMASNDDEGHSALIVYRRVY